MWAKLTSFELHSRGLGGSDSLRVCHLVDTLNLQAHLHFLVHSMATILPESDSGTKAQCLGL